MNKYMLTVIKVPTKNFTLVYFKSEILVTRLFDKKKMNINNYIYIYMKFATIDSFIFMKVYIRNQHLFTWTQMPTFLFFGPIKAEG